MRRRSRGLGLIELLVAAGLLGVVLTVAYDTLIPILRMWQTNRAQADMEQAGLVLQTRLRDEMESSTTASLSTLANPPAVSFLSFGQAVGGYDPSTGKPQWQKYVIYYLDTTNRILYRKEWPQPVGLPVPPLLVTLPTTQPGPLTPIQLLAVVNTENGTEARAALYVSSFSATLAAGAVNVDLQLATQAVGGLKTSDHQLSFSMRN